MRLCSRWCIALMLMQPGLFPATSCPFSVRRLRRWRQRAGVVEGEAGKKFSVLRRTGIETEEKGNGQKGDLVCRLFGGCTDARVSHQQGRKMGLGAKTAGESCKRQLVCVHAWPLCLCCNGRRMSLLWQRQQECYGATEDGIGSIWQVTQGSTEKADERKDKNTYCIFLAFGEECADRLQGDRINLQYQFNIALN